MSQVFDISVASARGLGTCTMDVRVICRQSFDRHQIVEMDLGATLTQVKNMLAGKDTSGLVNAIAPTLEGAKTGRAHAVLQEDARAGVPAWARVLGRTIIDADEGLNISRGFVIGSALSQRFGKRVKGLVLAATSAQFDCIFDGVEGFGQILAGQACTAPTITAIEDITDSETARTLRVHFSANMDTTVLNTLWQYYRFGSGSNAYEYMTADSDFATESAVPVGWEDAKTLVIASHSNLGGGIGDQVGNNLVYVAGELGFGEMSSAAGCPLADGTVEEVTPAPSGGSASGGGSSPPSGGSASGGASSGGSASGGSSGACDDCTVFVQARTDKVFYPTLGHFSIPVANATGLSNAQNAVKTSQVGGVLKDAADRNLCGQDSSDPFVTYTTDEIAWTVKTASQFYSLPTDGQESTQYIVVFDCGQGIASQ